MKISVEKKIVLGFVASVAALLSMGWLSYRTTADSITAEDWVTHTYQVIATLNEGRALLADTETKQRGYLLTGNEQFLNDSETAQAQVGGWISQIRQLTADNSEQQQRLNRLMPLIFQRLAVLNSRVKVRQERGLQAVAGDVNMLGEGRELMDQVRKGIAEMNSAEVQLLHRRQQLAQDRAKTAQGVIMGGAALACVVGLLAVLLIHRDLKMRAQAETTLQQNEERFRLMIACVKDYAIIMLDPEGRVVNWNDGAQCIKGYAAPEIVGQHFSRFYPADAVRDGVPGKKLADAAAAGRAEDEGWRVRKDGSQFWANVVITAIRNSGGRLLGFVKVTRDLTDHRRAARIKEERDRFFDLSRDIICVAGLDGYFKTLNPAWEQTLGFSREELLARPFLEFIHPDDVPASQAEVEKLASGRETVNFENRFRCRDGSWRWFAWNARADVPHQLIYATGRDITEQKQDREQIVRLNSDLQQHTDQLEAANKELEAFSYSVSHDLRSPLRHIDGFVGLLAKQAVGKLDERERRYLNIIADSARRMGALIDDLLVFSRMGRAELRRMQVSPESLIDEAVDALQNEMNGRRIVWKIGALPEVEADPAMLRQVWANLIGNAVKYTRPCDPAEIEIGCNHNNGEFVFHIRDNGVGFDMQYAHKLFGVFQRLHRSEDFEGTGIGLANVQRVIHRHGGRVWAEGKIAGGAIFYFSLPKTQTQPKG